MGSYIVDSSGTRSILQYANRFSNKNINNFCKKNREWSNIYINRKRPQKYKFEKTAIEIFELLLILNKLKSWPILYSKLLYKKWVNTSWTNSRNQSLKNLNNKHSNLRDTSLKKDWYFKHFVLLIVYLGHSEYRTVQSRWVYNRIVHRRAFNKNHEYFTESSSTTID